MLLAIDAGNTNVVFALVDDEGVIKTRWRIATDPRRTADEYAVWLHQLLAMEGFKSGDVRSVTIGTVVPRALHNLTVLSQKYFHLDPLIAGQDGWPIALDVPEPGTVGADRALNAIAGHALHDGDLIIDQPEDDIGIPGIDGKQHGGRLAGSRRDGEGLVAFMPRTATLRLK